MHERFLSEHLEETPKLVPFKTFEAVLARDEESPDPWLGRFLEMNVHLSCLMH